MSEKNIPSRRNFIKKLSGTAAMLAAGPLLNLTPSSSESIILTPQNRISSKDKIRIGTIGMGIMGNGDTRTALQVPGVELVGVADLYTGRLTRAKEVFGSHIFTTRDYRELISRKDIDAVIVSTADLWHNTISIHAMEQGKAVYCEKPMVQHIDLGHPVIEAQRRTGRTFQVGSQRVSNIAFAKAKEIFKNGQIGKLNLVVAKMNRHDALGAWQYSIPPDASPSTVDFHTFLKNTPKVPFDPIRFFRWRNYQAYGTGIPGDLFVHLISGLHFITDSLGPKRIFASGSLSYWKDGRDVPDVMEAILDYPETPDHPPFQMMLQVDFADGSGGGEYTRLIGTEGAIELSPSGLRVTRQKLPIAPGYGGWDSFETFPIAIQKEFVEQYDKKYPPQTRTVKKEDDIVFSVPKGYNDQLDHLHNFFDCYRTGRPVVEDAHFGFRAAAAAIACNMSYFEKKPILWDPVNMKLIS
ncbi:MAG: Gfo/Idh/MocA family protein [Chitinophagaceae bacterium]